MCEYDTLAEIYELWSTGDPAYFPSHEFYVHLCRKSINNIVELGIGTGRIAIDIAKSGKTVTGIDISSEMLAYCQENAQRAGVEQQITLIQSDFRDFRLPQSAEFIIFPFRSIGHLLTFNDKQLALRQIYENLVPGGHCVFDHYIFNEHWAQTYHGVPRLMYGKLQPDQTGLFIWDIYLYDFPAQQMQCFIVVEKTDEQGQVLQKTYHPLSFSWILPDQVRKLVTEIGFEIEALYGDFSFDPFDEYSENQIWVIRRPS
jgi:ubiquinone/menaquinone biosynthesis C-methylase UbiE